MTPSLPNEKTNSPHARSRRGLGVALGLGLLAAAGAASVWHPSEHALLMTSTSAAAAEAIAPSAVGLPSFANLVDQLKPAVVSVYVEAEIGNVASRLGQGQRSPEGRDEMSPFEFFFRQFDQPNAPAQRVHAQGSGFFISADGYVLTNNHVVDHAKRVQIKTVEGKTLAAKVVGTDAKTDVALLKVEGGGFPFVKFASTRPRVGDWVLAMGNPFGLGGTVTAGIVSASGRDIGSGPYDDFLQIDAPVNKGNSGGPTLQHARRGHRHQHGDLLPVRRLGRHRLRHPGRHGRSVAEQLKSKGVVSRGWIGVMVQPVTADIADSLGLKEAKGALIDDVQHGSPAAKAGLHSGDLVLSAGGAEIKDARDLARKIAALAPGKTLDLQIRRGNADQSISVTAAAYPNEQTTASGGSNQPGTGQSEPKLGLFLAPASEVEGAGSQGLVVMSVDPNGVAAEKGLQQGDVILDAGGKTVTAPADLTTAVSEARKAGKRSILMRVRTADNSHYVALPLSARG